MTSSPKKRAVRAIGPLAALALVLGASGCATKTVKKGDTTTTTAGVESASSLPDELEPSARGGDIQSVPSLEVVYFDFDSAKLTGESAAVLSKNAAWLKDNPDVTVQVAGHCDQRGTTAYNLALGQRRSKAVREYYGALGVRGSRVATISYGEEKPACVEETEGCWHANRRAETLMLVPKPKVR